ncbi:ABC transporter ATP-binding protein [Frondihabitans sucicola]|uniref:ABC transporter ATP-binding protein n=1 Tax=Frondihabitans sucicola TaxID=1268041 RepID=A0ABN6Y2I4_9MICO|nr:ABC transporter ATP-binding protein [Frondihabitans sucicola]BDZ51418.1 ABC transporter ATP-binding protein [Frondihabitans sucicola]
MTAVVEVEGLSISYRTERGLTEAVSDVSFRLQAGQTLAVVGGSGSGKSSTAHAIVGLLPENAVVTSGRITVAGHEVLRLSERRLARIRGSVVGLVPQDPTVSLDPVQTVGRQIVEALIVHGRQHRRVARAEAVRILERVGIDQPAVRFGQYPHELSGGQRQRVLIGIATACEPQLVIADEATSGLDVTVQKRVLDQLETLAAEQGTAVVLITHDLGVAADRSDAILVLDHGRIVEAGATPEVVRNPQHAVTRRLFDSAPSLAVRSAADRVEDRPSRNSVAAEAHDRPPLIAVRDLRKEFTLSSAFGPKQRLLAVDGVDFRIPAGGTFALVGESGSGKSTTARIVAGFEKPTWGTVSVDGEIVSDLGAAGRRTFRSRVQFVHQNPFASLDPSFRVEDIVAEPLRSFRVGTPSDRKERAVELLAAVGLSADLARRRPAELSGGQRQRVAIARALAIEPELVILDEAVSALDVVVQREVLDLLAELRERLGVAYLFISHDLAVVRLVADTVGVLQHGRLVEQGAVERVFEAPETDYTRELLAAIPGTGSTLRRPLLLPTTTTTTTTKGTAQ